MESSQFSLGGEEFQPCLLWTSELREPTGSKEEMLLEKVGVIYMFCKNLLWEKKKSRFIVDVFFVVNMFCRLKP